jgi:hypothetical protein
LEKESPRILPAKVGSDSGLVSVTTSPSPLKQARVETFAEVGQTVAEMLAAAGYPFGNDAYHSIVLVDGEELSEEQALTYRPKVGEYITASIVPHGGKTGKAILGVLLGILMIASGVGALAGGWAAAVEAGTAWSAVAGIAGGLVSVAGAIYSAVAPPPTQPFSGDVPTSQQSRALQGVRNDMRPYEIIPSVLGKHRMFPPFLAKPYTEIVGNDQYLRILFTFGYGPLSVTDLKIGETSFADYNLVEGTDYNILEGFTDDGELSLFTEDVDELDLTWELSDLNADETFGTGSSSNWESTAGTESQGEFTTELNSAEASVDIVFPGGLIAFKDEDGEPISVAVYFLIEFQAVGATSWTSITPTNELADGVSITSSYEGNIKIKAKERGTVTRGIRWSFPSAGQYNVRIRRTNTTLNGSTSRGNVSGVKETNRVYDSVWSKLRSIKPYTGATIPNLCKLEMRIKASDRLSGMLDTVNGVAQNWVNKWDNVNGWGSKTLYTSDKNSSLFLTRNPAWQYAHVLRGHQNSRPVEDDRIDQNAIAAWAVDCESSSGELGGTGNARTFDAVIDFPLTVRKLLDDIAGSARASFNIVDGMYSVVVDKAKPNVIQHFTPRNSSAFTGSKTFKRKTHGIKVNFINPEIGYKPEERIVYNDGFSKDGNKSVHLDFKGTMTPTSRIANGPGAGTWWTNLTASSNGGVTRLTTTGTDQRFRNTNSYPLGIDTTGTENLPRYVRLKARRVSKGSDAWEGRCYFQTGTDSFTGTKVHQIIEPEWDQGWQWLVWDMQEPTAGSWMGTTIDRLRFDLTVGHASDGSVFEISELIVDDGTQEATEFSSMDLWGQTDPDQAWRDGRYHMASYQLRPEIYTLEADVEHIVCTRGDKVRVTHDVMAVGYGAARLTEITLNGSSQFISGKMDESFNYLPDKTYQVHIRKRDGQEVSIPLSTLSGESNELKVSKDSSGADIPVTIPGLALAVDDLVLFGESEKNSGEYLVHAVTPKQDLAATLTLVDYNEAIYDPGTVPTFVSNTTTQQLPEIEEPPMPSITSVVSDETVMTFTGGIPTPRILVRTSVPSRAKNEVPPTHIGVEIREVDSTGSPISGWRPAPVAEVVGSRSESSFYDLDVGGIFEVRARSISNANNTSSEWSAWGNNPHTFVGGSALPADVVRSRVTRDYVLQWDYPDAPNDLKGFIVKYQGGDDSTWSTGAKAHEGFVSTTNFRLKGIIPYGESTVMVKAVDWFGNESENANSSVVNIAQDSRENVINTVDFAAQIGGTGPYWVDAHPSHVKITNGTVSGTEIVGDVSGSSVYWINPNRAFWSADATGDFWDDTYLDMTVQFEAVTHHAVNVPCRVSIDTTSEGGSFTTEFAQASSFKDFTFSSIEGVFDTFSIWPGELTMSQSPPTICGVPGGGQEGVCGAYSIMAWKVTITGGRTRPKLKTAKMYVDAPVIEEVFSDQSITNASNGLRLVPTLDFKKITSVQVTMRENPVGSNAKYTHVIDIDDFNSGSETGPLVKAYNWDTSTQTANFDAVIRGY